MRLNNCHMKTTNHCERKRSSNNATDHRMESEFGVAEVCGSSGTTSAAVGRRACRAAESLGDGVLGGNSPVCDASGSSGSSQSSWLWFQAPSLRIERGAACGPGKLPMVHYVHSGRLIADARTGCGDGPLFFASDKPPGTNVSEPGLTQRRLAMPTNNATGGPKA